MPRRPCEGCRLWRSGRKPRRAARRSFFEGFRASLRVHGHRAGRFWGRISVPDSFSAEECLFVIAFGDLTRPGNSTLHAVHIVIPSLQNQQQWRACKQPPALHLPTQSKFSFWGLGSQRARTVGMGKCSQPQAFLLTNLQVHRA